MIHKLKKTFLFFILGVSTCFPRSNLTIRDIQVGAELNKTRISFLLSRPASLYVEPSEEDSVWVKTPEDTFWKIPVQQEVGRGALMSYKLEKVKGQRMCRLQLGPYTRVVGSFLRGNTYILDLITEEPPIPEPQPEIEEEIEEEQVPEPALPPTVNIQQTFELPQNEINSLTITPKEDGTTWIIINSDKEEFFDSQIIPSTHKLYLYLPKINWPSLQTEILTSGNVVSYTVDESNPTASAVIMDLKQTTDLVDLLSSPNLDGTYDFILVLADRQATEIETKNLAEKRVELKSKIGSGKALSFKVNPPELVSEPVALSAEMPPIELEKRDKKRTFDKKEEEDPLFDSSDLNEQKQEPAWVSEARYKLEEK